MRKFYLAIFTLILFVLAGCAKENENITIGSTQAAAMDKGFNGNQVVQSKSESSDSEEAPESSNSESVEVRLKVGLEDMPEYEGEIDAQKYEDWEIDNIIGETQNAINSYISICQESEKDADGNIQLTISEQREILEALEQQGYAVASEKFNMPNYEKVVEAVNAMQENQEVSLGVYQIQPNGDLTRNTFISENGNKYFFRVFANIDDSGEPLVEKPENYRILNYTKLSDKGYFFYGFLSPGEAGFRVTPLNEKNRELTQSYIDPLGYVGHTALTQNWSEEDFSNLNFNDLFETLYKMKYGDDPLHIYEDQYTVENSYIIEVPENIFESAVTEYFRIPTSVLKDISLYDERDDTYLWTPHVSSACPPIPEVVDYSYNDDGSINLTVDAVMPGCGQDRIFTSELVVLPKDNGGCYYISNHVDVNANADLPLFAFGESVS